MSSDRPAQSTSITDVLRPWIDLSLVLMAVIVIARLYGPLIWRWAHG